MNFVHRNCFNIILRKVKIVPDLFEKFCCILKTDPRFSSLVESMIVCFVAYSSEAEIKEYINIDALVVYLNNHLNANEKVALNSNSGSDVIRNGISREDYFITILKRKNRDFVKIFMECLALDNTYHIELYQLLQSLIDSFNDMACNVSANSIRISVGTLEYKEQLKQCYLQNSKPVAEDNFEGSNINQFINLSLMTPEQHGGDEYEYFKAITDPYSLLFKHKQNDGRIILKSLPEIFDFSGVGRQVILIQGSPGSGKTTLANEICRQWARGTLIQNFTHVIMLKLRDPRIVHMGTIDEVIYCSNSYASFVYEAVRDIHCSHGANILILLEGWDELHEDRQCNSFLADIVTGKVLKDASVLITSRPSSIGTIQKSLVTRNIAILGFSEDQIKQYLQHCLEGSLKRRFLAELDNHVALKSLACIPVNLSILVHVFKQCGKKLPVSWTELYQQYILLKLSHYNLRMDDAKKLFENLDELPHYIKDNLKALSKVAFHELRNDKFTFNEEQIQPHGQVIPVDFDGMGLLQVENHIMQKSNYRTFSFLHRTIQEFAAAWYLSQLHCDDQTTLLIDILKNKANNYEMVLVFYAGLTGLKSIDLEAILSAVIRKELLSRFAVSVMSVDLKLVLKSSRAAKNFRIAALAEEYYSIVTSSTFSCETLLVLITCCAEAQNPAACRTLCSSSLFYSDACYIKVPESALTSQVLSSLSYCIVNSGKKWRVDCPHLCVNDILCLHKYFDTNKICGELTDMHTHAGNKEIEHFTMLIQSQCQLRCLDLTGSISFDDYCVTVLADILACNKHLIILQLRNCCITSKGLITIAKMLQTNNVLEWINLERNSFSSNDLKLALHEMTNNTSLVFLEVDWSLIDKEFKDLLVKFNENRETHLRMHFWEVIHGFDTVDWVLRKLGNARTFFKKI